jgi:hypothetical protein
MAHLEISHVAATFCSLHCLLGCVSMSTTMDADLFIL